MEAAELEWRKLRDCARDFARASRSICSSEEGSLCKLVEVLKLFRKKALRLVCEAQNRPVLFVYAADATSLLCRADAEAALAGTLVRSRGRSLLELLMQRGVVKTVSAAGEERLALLFTEPKQLTMGKSVWHVFAAASRFFPVL